MIVNMIGTMLDEWGKTATIQSPTYGAESYTGENAVSWTDKIVTVGVISSAKGKEQLIAEKNSVKVTHILYVPFAEVTTEDRVSFENMLYNITFIDDPMMGHEYLKLFLERAENID